MLRANQIPFASAVFATLLTYLPPATAQTSQVHLLCRGEIEFDYDGVYGRKERKPSTIDVSIDLEGKTAQLGGPWGCLADFGTSQGSALCGSRLPVAVSDLEIAFSMKATNERYATNSSFTLNRNSGNLAVSSVAVALPAANAKWNLFSIQGNLSCVRQSKLF